MVVPNGHGNKILTRDVKKEANERKLNIKTLVKDLKANGQIFIRSKSTVEEMQRLDDSFTYTFDKETQTFELRYKYTTE